MCVPYLNVMLFISFQVFFLDYVTAAACVVPLAAFGEQTNDYVFMKSFVFSQCGRSKLM